MTESVRLTIAHGLLSQLFVMYSLPEHELSCQEPLAAQLATLSEALT
jgi:hypothetical protein